jgi:hypothetical protein
MPNQKQRRKKDGVNKGKKLQAMRVKDEAPKLPRSRDELAEMGRHKNG